MKTIINIARNELRQLFYSPIAWVLLALFFVISGISFTSVIGSTTSAIAMGRDMNSGLTMTLFGRLLSGLQTYIYLFVPLLTMGMISNEKSSGSIKLLLSSPVNNTQLVLGKFGSMMVYALVLLLSVAAPVIFGSIIVKALDIWPILVGLLGLYLLTLTYAAVGIFMSSLTRYPIVAAVGAIAALFMMNYSRRLWQDVPFVRDITYWLGMSGRSNTFVGGLITSEDLIYFITLIVMFLCLTAFTLRKLTLKEPVWRRTLRYTGVILAACLVGYASTRPALMGYYDATRMKTRTLSEKSQEVMKQLDGPLTITTYVNLLEADYRVGLPIAYNTDVARFEQYRRFKPDMKMKYVYYYNFSNNNPLNQYEMNRTLEERAERTARAHKTRLSLWNTPAEIDSIADLGGEDYRFVRVIDRGDGRTSRLRLYDDLRRHPGEGEVIAALKRLTVKAPKVGILVGHGERDMESKSDGGYFFFARNVNFRYALMNQGFDVDTVSLAGGAGVPADIDILVISDPGGMIPPAEMVAIEKYIDSGGHMLIASKPRRSEFVEPILERIGVGFIPGTLVQEGADRAPNVIVGDITAEADSMSRRYRAYARRNYNITAPGVSGLTWRKDHGFKVYPMITTDSLATDTTRVWNELETTDFGNFRPEFNPAAGERLLDTVPIVIGLERTVAGREQRIVVMGDADIISNAEFMTRRTGIRAANYAVIEGNFGWLTADEFPVDTGRRSGPDDEIRYISFRDRGWMNALFIWIIPAGIIVFGLILLVRRKGR